MSTESNDSRSHVQGPSDESNTKVWRQPFAYVFDPASSPEHRELPSDLLLAYNEEKDIFNLRRYDEVTGILSTDPHTLVVCIDAVTYDSDLASGRDRAGAAVRLHPMSLWNAVFQANKSKEEAKLEAFGTALGMIRIAKQHDPSLQRAYIRCVGEGFCYANAKSLSTIETWEKTKAEMWLQKVDKKTVDKVDALARDVTKADDGGGHVEVYLWRVPQNKIGPVSAMATPGKNGLDWYKEKWNSRPSLHFQGSSNPACKADSTTGVLFTATLHERLEIPRLVVPESILGENPKPEKIWRWKAATKSVLYQAHLTKVVASNGYNKLTYELQGMKGSLYGDNFVNKYEIARRYSRSSKLMQLFINNFHAEQKAIRSTAPTARERGTGNSISYAEARKSAEIEGRSETLIQELKEMDWEHVFAHMVPTAMS